MNILALESSAVAASAALTSEETPIGIYYQNSGQTHSRTLLPMVQALLANCDKSLDDVDCIAVAVGPGSFTGLRIGIAAAKGLAWPAGKPCCGVSTLEAMAWNLCHMEGDLLCCVMDARRKQVYNALFEAREGRPLRLCPDRAVSLEDLAAELPNDGRTVWLIGDGAALCGAAFSGRQGIRPAPPHLRFQNAWGVARAALDLARKGETVTAEALAAVYLRLPQAERERLERLKKQKETM